jgi:hypothetical protein
MLCEQVQSWGSSVHLLRHTCRLESVDMYVYAEEAVDVLETNEYFKSRHYKYINLNKESKRKRRKMREYLHIYFIYV